MNHLLKVFLKMIRDRVVAVSLIFYVLMFFQRVAGDCEYQAYCTMPNTTYIKETLSCQSLNRSTVSNGDCGINPVTKGYKICSDAHNVTEGETNKHCQVTNLQVDPCESYPTDGSFGVCKSGSYGEISENHPPLITPPTILNSIIPTLNFNGPTQANITSHDNYVTTTSGASNKQSTSNSNPSSGVIIAVVIVCVVGLFVLVVGCMVLFICCKKKWTDIVKSCCSENSNPSNSTMSPSSPEQDESEQFVQPSNTIEPPC